MKKIILASLLFVFSASFASAATSDTSVVIQPSKIEATASPDQKLAKYFSVINRSNYDVKLKLVVKDYRQISDEGKLEFYDAKTEPASQWLVPQFLEIGLKPLETKQIGVVLNVPKGFSTGGHYGAILFQPSGSNAGVVDASNFGELILLTVAGDNVKAVANVKSVNFWTGFLQQGANPVDFNFKIQNTGNTHFDALAKLVVKDWLGKEVGNYNIGQLTVYPNTSRLFQWRWNGTPWVGAYKAEVLINNKPVDGAWFILFPWQVAVGILLLGILGFAGVKYRQRLGFTIKLQNKALMKN